jgi:hypothetical protein
MMEHTRPGITVLLFVLTTLIPATKGFQFQPLEDPHLMKPFSINEKVATKTMETLPLSSMTPNVDLVDDTKTSLRHALDRKKWGIDKDHANEYWFDKRIHTLGNTGFGGAFHAALAPVSTKLIDLAAYDGKDIRQDVSVLF